MSDEEEKVGYKRPPKKHQFKKGQSGNPKGRPKRKPLTDRVELDILDQPVLTTMNGRKKSLGASEILIRQMANNAIAGNVRDAIKFLKLCDKHEVIEQTPKEQVGGVVFAPPGMTTREWLLSLKENGGDQDP